MGIEFKPFDGHAITPEMLPAIVGNCSICREPVAVTGESGRVLCAVCRRLEIGGGVSEMAYKIISRYESWGKYAIGVQIHVSVTREVGKDESFDISCKADEIAKILLANYVKQAADDAKSGNEDKTQLIACFPKPIYVEEIPNGYWNDWYAINRPWLIVATQIGRIKIGWRKRVISIDWTDSITKTEAKVLFPDEDVTKDGRMIHAYGYDKAKEYIKKIIAVGLAPWEDYNEKPAE